MTIVVLGTAEWSAPIATNQHYVARELSKSAPVVFVEGYGTRRPELSLDYLRRAWRRLRAPNRSVFARATPVGVRVVRPWLVPIHVPVMAPINRFLLRMQVRQYLTRRYSLWSFTPFTYGMEEESSAAVYHLVDLLHENPRAFRRSIIRAERHLGRSGVVRALATSAAIAEHLRQVGFNEPLTAANAADTQLFAAHGRRVPTPARRGAIFVGNVTPSKVDIGLLRQLVATVGAANVTVMGPVALGGDAPPDWVREFEALGVNRLGLGEPGQVAAAVAQHKVGLVPYRITELTKGISPLKVYEYLAGGCAVVSVPLAAVTQHADCVWVEPTRETFCERVLALLDAPLHPDVVQMRIEQAAAHSWSRRAATWRDLIGLEPLDERVDHRDVA